MWVFLSVLAFIAGQGYLFYLLNRLDRFLDRRSDPPPEKKALTVAFADPCAADSLADLLERFSQCYPEIGIRLCSCPDVLDAVYAGKAAVGFLQAERFEYPGLQSFPMTVKTAPVMLAGCGLEVIPLEAETKQEIVWKKNSKPSCADVFVQYIRCNSQPTPPYRSVCQGGSAEILKKT